MFEKEVEALSKMLGFVFNNNTESMKFLEKDLEDIIWESDRIKLSERGLTVKGKLKRQLKIGGYGIADLVSFEKQTGYYGNRYLKITVYELKKDKIGISAFLQAINYVRGIKSYIKMRNKNIEVSFSIILVGKEVDESGSFCFISNLITENKETTRYDGFLDNVEFYTYKYSIDGLQFIPENNYDLSNKGFTHEY